MSSPAASADNRRLLRFAPGCRYESAGGSAGRLVTTDRALELRHVAEPFARLLLGLPRPTGEAVAAAAAMHPACLPTLRSFAGRGLLEEWVVDAAGGPVLVARHPRLPVPEPPGDGLLRLHGHAFLRPGDAGWVLRCPGLRAGIQIFDLAADLQRWEKPVRPGDLDAMGQVLRDEGFLVDAAPGDAEAGLEFHDALFHAVSARGELTDGGYGARGQYRPSAAPARSGSAERGAARKVVELPLPGDVRTPALHEVFDARRSCRQFAAEAVGVDTLGTLLALALRTRARHPRAPDCALHAYPSAGALDEITTFVAVAYPRPALGRYLQDEHALAYLEADDATALEVVAALCRPCGITDPLPAVGLLFAADCRRMAAKYESIAYANILRDVGAVYQTVALSAVALGLGACAVGGGWAGLEDELAGVLGGRLIVGGMVAGVPGTEP